MEDRTAVTILSNLENTLSASAVVTGKVANNCSNVEILGNMFEQWSRAERDEEGGNLVGTFSHFFLQSIYSPLTMTIGSAINDEYSSTAGAKASHCF